MKRIEVRALTADDRNDLDRCDNSFTVESEIRVEASCDNDGDRMPFISYTVEPVAPYQKRYGPEPHDAVEYTGREDHAGWLAYADGELAGQILVRENWNGFGIVDDIAVAPRFRRMGVGSRLMEQAIAWARGRGLPGLMLETQNINVPACRLYASCGFVLGGFDRYLYEGNMPGTNEVALFWYLRFDPR